jgi:hypothetical protein
MPDQTEKAHDRQGNASYNRRPRSWPLTSVRSWEEVR